MPSRFRNSSPWPFGMIWHPFIIHDRSTSNSRSNSNHKSFTGPRVRQRLSTTSFISHVCLRKNHLNHSNPLHMPSDRPRSFLQDQSPMDLGNLNLKFKRRNTPFSNLIRTNYKEGMGGIRAFLDFAAWFQVSPLWRLVLKRSLGTEFILTILEWFCLS